MDAVMQAELKRLFETKLNRAMRLYLETCTHCGVCVEACPLGETAITISPATGKVRVKKDGCIGCGLCESRCPTEPRSIFVVPFTPRADPIIA